jgi:hypothetical protein
MIEQYAPDVQVLSHGSAQRNHSGIPHDHRAIDRRLPNHHNASRSEGQTNAIGDATRVEVFSEVGS